jgi:hypothetical protein
VLTVGWLRIAVTETRGQFVNPEEAVDQTTVEDTVE